MSNICTNAYRLMPLALLPAAVLALGACERRTPAAAAPTVVVALAVQPVRGATGGQSLRYPIEAAPRYSTPLSFRVAGKLVERSVHVGDTVRAGQILARLDAADAARQAAANHAALEAAEHRLAFAKQQLDRDNAQFAQALIAESALEQTKDAHSAAQAAREQAADQWVVARNALAYHQLAADHDGVITSESADAGQNLAAGQAVYGLAWTGAIDVTLDAAAADLGRIAPGQPARVTFAALPSRHFDARVREVAPDADPQSRTYHVKLTLDQSDPAVHFGMTGDALLETGAADGGTPGSAVPDVTVSSSTAFQIPSTAVFHRGNLPAVWVIRPGDSTLELRPVTVSSYSERAAVVTRGLAAGDQVVSAGVHTVFAGQHVTAVKAIFSDDGITDARRSDARRDDAR
jgi:multidrug efflux system membrane fusion protein